MIINPAGEDERYLEWLTARGIAVVLLDHRRSAGLVSSVVVDDVLGGRLAGEHLVSLGHRRIGLVNGPSTIPQCEDRRIGLLAALAGAGLDPERDLVEVRSSRWTRPPASRRSTRSSPGDPPTAVFCANDLLAIGVLRGLRMRGLRAPDDVAVVGYDDVELAAMTDPPLTTVHQPTLRARRDRLRAAAGGAPPEQRSFSPHLVRRESA